MAARISVPARMPDLPLLGGCQCGQLRYEVSKLPLTLYCCHCTQCQSQSASAFGMSLRVPVDAVTMHGDFGSWERDPESERAVQCIFCPLCGTRIVHRGRAGDTSLSIKAGTLDKRDWLYPVGHIWAGSAQKWVRLEGLIYLEQPTDGYAALAEAFSRHYSAD